MIARNVIGRHSLEEAPAVPEGKTVDILRDDDAFSPRIVLMGDAVVECYCYDNSKGYEVIYPWKPCSEWDSEQREYERQLLAEYEAALSESVPLSDLTAAYQKGVNAAYDQE